MTEKQRSKFDSKWLILLVVIVSVITTTIIMNNDHANNTGSKFAGAIETDNGDLKIDWTKYPTTNIELTDSLTITKSGTYYLTGTLEDGYIEIKGDKTSKVRIILDNVNIYNSIGPAISCIEADDFVIEFTGDNSLEDGVAYSSDYDDDITGAIYSKGDLSISGDGTLEITANYADAIVGKDDLKIDGGTYTIKAKDDGIRGKDSVYIVSGRFNLDTETDAIKSTNETDSGKGFVLIENGNINIKAGAKGIKATNSILINGGEYMLNTYDDAIHSNNYIGITGGTFAINSSDDAIHANSELIIDNGEINIARSYEGLEAQVVTINNGKISVIASDDGINAGGGNDSSSMNRPGANPFNADENCKIDINDGEIYLNTSGDGIDSNGWVNINGGNITIDGPTNNDNGALDAGMGIVMNGGKVIAIGSSGMAETLGQNSRVNNISVYLDKTYSAKTLIEIKNSKSQTIIEHTSAKSFSNLTIGTEDFEFGEVYTIYLNGEKSQIFTITDITTTIGNNNTNQKTPPQPNKP